MICITKNQFHETNLATEESQYLCKTYEVKIWRIDLLAYQQTTVFHDDIYYSPLPSYTMFHSVRTVDFAVSKRYKSTAIKHHIKTVMQL